MQPDKLTRKRPAPLSDAGSDSDPDEFPDLDGVLSEDEEEEDPSDVDDDQNRKPAGANSAQGVDGSESEAEGPNGDELDSESSPGLSEDDDEGEELDHDGAGGGGGAHSLTTSGAAAQGDDDNQPNYRITTDANGGVRYEYPEIDPVYDSDDSAQDEVNTIGNIPLSYYDSYPHIGYSIDGKKVMRPAAGTALDSLLDSVDVPKDWTGLTDPATGLPLKISQDERELLAKLRMGEIPEDGYDPYPDTIEFFSSIEEKMPLSAAPEPKRRFVPSKHEAKRVAKLVRLIREGKIMPYKPPEEREEEEEEERYYDVWANEEAKEPHIMNLAAPKLAPPGHDESINPPEEYLLTEQEKKEFYEMDPEDRPRPFEPRKYDALRKVPAYENLVKERFERCLDLYLAPRVRKNKLNIDPMSLLPKLPRAEDLKPFPTTCQMTFSGHEGRVRSISVSPNGEFVASGGDDGTVCVWDMNGHLEYRVKLSSDDPVDEVQWRPTKDTLILAAVAGDDIFMIIPDGVGEDAVTLDVSRDVLDAGFGYATNAKQGGTTANGVKKEAPGVWSRPGERLEAQGVHLKITVKMTLKSLRWHRRGDYFCTVSPNGGRSAVAIHQLSKHSTQIPFRRLKGIPQVAQFHPSRPLFFVATKLMIRCYDLQLQKLTKVIQPGARHISSFDVHPGGDNVIVGSYDRRLLWHDLDLSVRPYKTMRFHTKAVRAVKFHKGGFPLFADASDDGTMQIFHGKVVSDMMENATIVPVKLVKGHKVVAQLGILDIDWHPKQPWLFSAGADGTCKLWC